MRSSRVMVIGLDGAAFRIIHPLLEQGLLPNMGAILQEGAHGTLLSVPNCNSGPAWTSMITGVNPGKHGVFHLVTRVPGTSLLRPTHAGDRRCPPLWRWIGEAGGRVIMMNLPVTYPAERVNGVLISGSDTPGPRSNRMAHPPGVMETIRREVGPYLIGPRIQGMALRGRVRAAWERLRKVIRCHERTILHLMKTEPWDLAWVVFTAIDAAQHYFWGHWESGDPRGEILPMVYREMDRVVGAIRAEAGPGTNFFLVSDHGAGPRRGASHLMKDLFVSCGMMRPRKGLQDLPFQLKKKVFLGLQGYLPIELQEALARWFPALFVQAKSGGLTQGVDLQRSLVYATDASEVHILKDYDSTVGKPNPPGDYQTLLARLEDLFDSLQDPVCDEPIRPEIRRAREIYWGPQLKRAPDLLLGWGTERLISDMEARDGARLHRISGPKDLNGFLISGTHRPEGILMAAGPRLCSGRSIAPASVYDIAPTILHLLDIPIPSGLDGRVLDEALTIAPTHTERQSTSQALADTQEAASGETYTPEERELVLRRLRDMGYMD